MISIHIPEELHRNLAEAFAKQRCCRLPRIPLSAIAFLAWAMQRSFQRTLVLVSNSLASQDELHRNLAAFAGPHMPGLLYYPALESTTTKRGVSQPAIIGDRLQTLIRLQNSEKPVLLATCIQALMQPTPAPAALRANLIQLKLQEEHDPGELMSRLEQMGYEVTPEVQFKGQTARRGGLLDIWPLKDDSPSRVEFFGSTVETIRSFDPADQRSFARHSELLIPPANEERLLHSDASARSLLMAHLPAEIIYFWVEPPDHANELGVPPPESTIKSHAAAYEKIWGEVPDGGNARSPTPGPSKEGIKQSTLASHQLQDELGARARYGHKFMSFSGASGHEMTVSFCKVQKAIADNTAAWQCSAGLESMPSDCGNWHAAPMIDPGFRAIAQIAGPPRGLFEPDIFENLRRQWLAKLEQRARQGMKMYFHFNTQGALDRFRETHTDTPFRLSLGAISDGFMHEAMRLAVIAESNLVGFQKLLPGHYDSQMRSPGHSAPTPPARGKARRRPAGEALTDWLSIEPGNLVVHVDHGIGKYMGLYEIEFDGRMQEALAIEYADKAKLYVPVSQTHLLSRYIGVGKRHAAVHRLGGKRWLREKAAAETAVRDLAASMLETQALRESRQGFSFPPDQPWQHEFEAAFPYQETDDQDQAIREVKQDMESARPMDRLICGDVGYGKTEVAMRAAFKAVMAGKQVALLVPTTVLAQQHYEVFLERMRAYPVRIELLCRLRTQGEQDAVVRGLNSGAVDIVIGTHRLFQPDIRFKNLGLLIIDEEQRFGVEHKERLKRLERMVDVLTLTATPIPRTLYMSLTGARDISMIQTPPKARLPIETRVVKNEDAIVREAIERELNRGGQIYYLHNRVMTIEKVRERLQRLAPTIRIGIVHGQMPTAGMAQVMHNFSLGKLDLLLCTTIIESGVDIPNVNTIIIDRADRFGMADLYQLRGRVGRSPRKAYAYLLLPVHGHLLDTPRQRLHAIMEHADLGAGFRLAMRDLEIRGAGNLLGVEQSGHIAAIGFDLYCQLLRRTVAQMSGEALRAKEQARSLCAKPSEAKDVTSPRDNPPLADSVSQTPRGFLTKEGHPALPAAPAPGRIVDVAIALDFIDLSAHAADQDCSAFLPHDYVEDERLRIAVYRKIAAAITEQEIEALRDEFQDRFGPLPGPLKRLLKIAVLRMLATACCVADIESRDGKLMLKRDREYLMLKHQFPRLQSASADARLEEIRHWLERVTEKGFTALSLN